MEKTEKNVFKSKTIFFNSALVVFGLIWYFAPNTNLDVEILKKLVDASQIDYPAIAPIIKGALNGSKHWGLGVAFIGLLNIVLRLVTTKKINIS